MGFRPCSEALPRQYSSVAAIAVVVQYVRISLILADARLNSSSIFSKSRRTRYAAAAAFWRRKWSTL